MEGQNPGEITALELAQGLEGIYEEFTSSIRALGAKVKGKKRSSKMGASFAHWVGGSHVNTDRDMISQDFLKKVQNQLELFGYALEGLDEEGKREACTAAAQIMMAPVPSESDSTIDLMKRAMIGQFRDFLPHLSKETLEQLKTQLDEAYGKWKKLPIEKEICKEMERLIRTKQD